MATRRNSNAASPPRRRRSVLRWLDDLLPGQTPPATSRAAVQPDIVVRLQPGERLRIVERPEGTPVLDEHGDPMVWANGQAVSARRVRIETAVPRTPDPPVEWGAPRPPALPDLPTRPVEGAREAADRRVEAALRAAQRPRMMAPSASGTMYPVVAAPISSMYMAPLLDRSPLPQTLTVEQRTVLRELGLLAYFGLEEPPIAPGAPASTDGARSASDATQSSSPGVGETAMQPPPRAPIVEPWPAQYGVPAPRRIRLDGTAEPDPPKDTSS